MISNVDQFNMEYYPFVFVIACVLELLKICKFVHKHQGSNKVTRT